MAKGKLKKAVNRLLAKTKIDDKIKEKLDELLDKTEIDDKIVKAYADAVERGTIDKIKCYTKCYGGYLLAVGAGCTFGANIWWGLGLLVAAGGWAYWQVCKCKACKANMPGGTCCNG